VHLIQSDQQEVRESFKVEVKADQAVGELGKVISDYLEKRNDGNKIYGIERV
jgi:septation ring formation regulator EzrA